MRGRSRYSTERRNGRPVRRPFRVPPLAAGSLVDDRDGRLGGAQRGAGRYDLRLGNPVDEPGRLAAELEVGAQLRAVVAQLLRQVGQLRQNFCWPAAAVVAHRAVDREGTWRASQA